jgi:ribosomal-protein-alanine N-acetyltransferase
VYPVELEGAKVRLREFRRDDADDALALVGDDRVTRWLSFDSRTREQAVDMIEGTIKRTQQEPRNEYYIAVTHR